VRRGAVLALAGALALGAAACGGSSNPSSTGGSASPPPPSATSSDASPSELMARAAQATSGTGSYRSSFEMVMDGPSGAITVSGNGEFETDPPVGQVTMDFSQMTGAAGGESTVIFDGRTIYMQIPGLGGAKPWFKIEAADLGAGAAASLGQFTQLSQGDPTQALQYLSGATDDIEEAGTETVRGAETTHYTMTIDLNAAAENAATPELKQAILDSIETSGVSEVPAEVWIDGDGRVRRMVTHYDGITTPQGTTDMTVTQELYDFGEDVNIEIPADDEVLDFGDLGSLLPTTTIP
jgi:hypothetical protein